MQWQNRTEIPRYKLRRGRLREDKSSLSEPRCPFCRSLFQRPVDIDIEVGYVYGGRCECGAVYTCDPTGRNLGEALMDALVLLTDLNWQEAVMLTSGVDYDEVILNYDIKNHRIVPKPVSFLGRLYGGKLLFVRKKY